MVIIISEFYPEKDWTNFEFVNGKDAEKIRSLEYLLPIRIDKTNVIGLKPSIAYVDLNSQSIQEIADLIAEKVELNS